MTVEYLTASKIGDMVEQSAKDREKVERVAEKSTGSSKEACGNHHGSEGPVENNQ